MEQLIIKKECSNSNDLSTSFNEMDHYFEIIRILCNALILDYSIIADLVKLIKKAESDIFSLMIDSFVEKSKQIFREHRKNFKSKKNFKNYCRLLHSSLYFMIILINLKEYQYVWRLIHCEHKKLFKTLLKSIHITKDFGISHQIEKIIGSLFFNEYKDLIQSYNLNTEFQNTYHIYSKSYSNLLVENNRMYYVKIFDFLMDSELSYDLIFGKVQMDDEEKYSKKMCLVQSILRATFSKVKNKYLMENIYTLNFISKICEQSVNNYWKKYGDHIKNLFRNDDIHDDLLKQLMYIFCNSFLCNSNIYPIKQIIKTTSQNNESSNLNSNPLNCDLVRKESIVDDLFIDFFHNFLDSFKNLPKIIKAVFKLIHNNIVRIYKIEQDNYKPLFTYFIFNFMTSPRIQEIYSISPNSNNIVKNLNKILRNICYAESFPEDDLLSVYNQIIISCNLKLKQVITKILGSMNEEDIKSAFDEIEITIPSFLFHHDCENIYSFIEKLEEFKNFNIFNVQSCKKSDLKRHRHIIRHKSSHNRCNKKLE